MRPRLRTKVRGGAGSFPRASACKRLAARTLRNLPPALVLTLEDRPGALARVAEKLAAAKINIKCAYATTGAMGGSTTVVLSVSNVDKAASVLGV